MENGIPESRNEGLGKCSRKARTQCKEGLVSKLATMMNDKLHDFLSHFIKCFSGLPPWVKKMRWGGGLEGGKSASIPLVKSCK